jgi:hypothetical protein
MLDPFTERRLIREVRQLFLQCAADPVSAASPIMQWLQTSPDHVRVMLEFTAFHEQLARCFLDDAGS